MGDSRYIVQSWEIKMWPDCHFGDDKFKPFPTLSKIARHAIATEERIAKKKHRLAQLYEVDK